MDKPFKEWTGQDFVIFLKGIDKKTWIKIGGVAAVLGVVIFFFIIPAWITRGEVKAKVKGFDNQIATLNTLKIREPELKRNKEKTLQFIYSAKERLFEKGEVALLLGQVSKLAQESNVTIISSRPRPTEVTFPVPFDTQYESYQYDFSVEGGYHDIGTFISMIETYPKLLRVELFEVRLGKKDDESSKLVASLSLSAVAFKQKVG